MFTLTWPQVLAFWLQRHFLEERAERDKLLEVVSRICGLHAQVISSAELAAWARIDKLDSGDVSAALWQERELDAAPVLESRFPPLSGGFSRFWALPARKMAQVSWHHTGRHERSVRWLSRYPHR
jgi:hypothetical protein